MTGVCIASKQKSKLTWVLYHAEAFFFCVMLCLITRPSRLISDFDSELDFDQWSCVLWASVPARDPAQPDPTQPGPARPRVPLAPTPPCAPPLPLSHLVFPRSNSLSLSLSSTSLSHLFALGDPVDGYRLFLDPKVSSPLLSLSLPLSLPFPFRACVPAWPSAPGGAASAPQRSGPRPPAMRP
jgi:hypothetical protein